MSCVYSPLQGSYAHNTINCRPFSATRHCICLQHAQSLWHLKTSEDSEPCTGPAYKPCHIDLRSLAPPQAYPRSPAATTSTDLLRAGTSARGPQLRKTHMSCFYSPLHGSYAHNTINYRPFSATRHKAGCKSVKATASRALIKHSINGASSLEA